MARPPHPDDPAGSAGSVPPWAADEARAAPAPAETAQIPLFHGAPPRARRVRLRARIKALLSARLRRPPEPPPAESATRPESSWPDSFFDGT